MIREETIEKFLKLLEEYATELDEKLMSFDDEQRKIEYLNEILKKLTASKLDFSIEYYDMSNDEKDVLKKALLTALKDKKIVNRITQEVINLYFLNSSNLLESENASNQKEEAYEAIDYLKQKLNEYIRSRGAHLKRTDKKILEDRLERVVNLAAAFEKDKMPCIIPDIDFLEEILAIFSLEDEERLEILKASIFTNTNSYRVILQDKEEVVSYDSTKKEEKTLDSDTIKKLDDLLNSPTATKRIVMTINDELADSININNPLINDIILESVNLARENIVKRLKENPTISLDEAIESFYREIGLTRKNQSDVLRELLKTTDASDLPSEEQDKIINKTFEYYEKEKSILDNLNPNKVDTINKYILSIFDDFKNRELIYRTESIYKTHEVEQMAIYEMGIIKVLSSSLTEEELDYQLLKSKISKRLEDIVRCLKIYKDNNE